MVDFYDAWDKGFQRDFEDCHTYMLHNLNMYLFGSAVLFICYIGMTFCPKYFTASGARMLGSFITIYQTIFAFWGCGVCWFNEDLYDLVEDKDIDLTIECTEAKDFVKCYP